MDRRVSGEDGFDLGRAEALAPNPCRLANPVALDAALRTSSGMRSTQRATFDPRHEDPITFRQACRLPFVRRNGKPMHHSTMYRWATRGVRNILLETVTIGGSLCTSEPALLRFIARLSGDVEQPNSQPAARERQIDAAEAELERAGF